MNNTLLQINLAVLTSSHNTFNNLDTSGFSTIRRYANIINILRNSKEYSYDSLNKMTNKKLKKLNALTTPQRTYITPATQAYIHRRNYVGAQLIGIAANSNVSQAILQHYDISLNSRPNGLSSFITPLDELSLNVISFRSLLKK